MTVQELEVAVRELPAVERKEFVAWLQEFLADEWDAQIEADILNGRFDAIGEEVDAAFERGECTPL